MYIGNSTNFAAADAFARDRPILRHSRPDVAFVATLSNRIRLLRCNVEAKVQIASPLHRRDGVNARHYEAHAQRHIIGQHCARFI